MEGTSGQRSRSLFTGRLPAWSWLHRSSTLHAKAASGAPGARQGCQRHGGFGGVWPTTPRANPIPPAEADRCAVKRTVSQSRFSRAQDLEKERGASLGEMLGTREA
jgi:hypothetical protein